MKESVQTEHGSRFARLRENRAVVFIAVLLIMFTTLALVARSSDLLRFDTAITREVQEDHTTPLDFLAYFFTCLGNAVTMTILSVGAAYLLRRTGRPTAAWFSVLTLLGLPLNMLLKLIVHRPRPTANLVRILFPEPGDSFPSGHAMCSVIVYGFLAYLAWTYIEDKTRRKFWTVVLATTPIGISLSRIYIGVHWFSDVIGAWMFGLICLLILADLYKVYGATERAPRTDPVAPVASLAPGISAQA